MTLLWVTSNLKEKENKKSAKGQTDFREKVKTDTAIVAWWRKTPPIQNIQMLKIQIHFLLHVRHVKFCCFIYSELSPFVEAKCLVIAEVVDKICLNKAGLVLMELY